MVLTGYAKTNRIALAFLDVELGKTSGFDPAYDVKPHLALANIRQRLELMCGGEMTVMIDGLNEELGIAETEEQKKRAACLL